MPADAPSHGLWTRHSPSSARFWTVAVSLVVAGFCAASVMMLRDLRRDTWTQAATSELNLAKALAEDVDRDLELFDLSLRAVADGLSGPDLANLSPRLQDMMLSDRAATGRYLGSMLVLDRDGKVTRGWAPGLVGADLADREYFKALKADPDQGLYVSAPFHRRVTGDDAVIALSRSLRAAEGSFAGVVVGLVQLDYFQRLLSRVDLGRQGSAHLFLIDGTCIMQLPYEATNIGRSFAGSPNFRTFLTASSGSFSGTASRDGRQRMYSFAHVGHLPMIVDVGLAEDDIFGVWRTKTAVIGVALAALCAIAGGLGLKLARQLERTSRSERRLSESEAEYRLLADNAQDVIMRLDPSLSRTYVSPACRTVLGYEPEELIGRSPKEVVHPDDWPTVLNLLLTAREGRSDIQAVYRVRHRDGSFVWVEGRYVRLSSKGGFIAVLRDVTLRKQAEEQAAALNAELSYFARNDALTGLANRRRFDEILDIEWRRAERENAPVSLLLLDVDRFKLFNDRYGHQGGDACLRAIATAVRGVALRADDLTARYGGEEIAVLLPGLDAASAAIVAERVRQAVEALTIPHDNNSQCGGVVTVSVGCATAEPATDHRSDAGGLIATADACLYEAKRTGRNRVMATLSDAQRAPVPADEAERLVVLDAYEAAGALTPSDTLDRIARTAAQLFDTPLAFVTVVGRDTVTLVGRHGTETGSAPRCEACCAHTILDDMAFVVPDAAADPRLVACAMAQNGLAFYAGVPLVSPIGGRRLGALCVVDTVPHPSLDARERDLLADLARLAMEELERRREAPSPAAAGAGRRAA